MTVPLPSRRSKYDKQSIQPSPPLQPIPPSPSPLQPMPSPSPSPLQPIPSPSPPSPTPSNKTTIINHDDECHDNKYYITNLPLKSTSILCPRALKTNKYFPFLTQALSPSTFSVSTYIPFAKSNDNESHLSLILTRKLKNEINFVISRHPLFCNDRPSSVNMVPFVLPTSLQIPPQTSALTLPALKTILQTIKQFGDNVNSDPFTRLSYYEVYEKVLRKACLGTKVGLGSLALIRPSKIETTVDDGDDDEEYERKQGSEKEKGLRWSEIEMNNDDKTYDVTFADNDEEECDVLQSRILITQLPPSGRDVGDEDEINVDMLKVFVNSLRVLVKLVGGMTDVGVGKGVGAGDDDDDDDDGSAVTINPRITPCQSILQRALLLSTSTISLINFTYKSKGGDDNELRKWQMKVYYLKAKVLEYLGRYDFAYRACVTGLSCNTTSANENEAEAKLLQSISKKLTVLKENKRKSERKLAGLIGGLVSGVMEGVKGGVDEALE